MDEVNLLDDGLVDVVLDSAASGVNTVEREGVSIAHPARFIMIGSGNPQARSLRQTLKAPTPQVAPLFPSILHGAQVGYQHHQHSCTPRASHW